MDLSDAAVDLFHLLWGGHPDRQQRWDSPHSSEFIELRMAGLIEACGQGHDGGRGPGYEVFRLTPAGKAYVRLRGRS